MGLPYTGPSRVKVDTFRIVLSSHPARPTLLKTGNALRTSSYVKTTSQLLYSKLETHICTQQAKADTNMVITKQQYKQDCNRQVRVTTNLQQGYFVFIDRPPLPASSDTDAARATLSTYNRLMENSLRPCCVEAARTHLLVIDEHGTDNVDSTDRDTRAPQTRRSDPVDICRARQQNKKYHKNVQ